MKLTHLFESVPELVPFLKANCAQALELISDGLFFYRGVPHETQETLYALPDFSSVPVIGPLTVDRARTPRDTPLADHEVMDRWFKKHKGFKARSQALFVTPNADQAGAYGAVYVVLPINHFNAYWSNEVRDLTVSVYNDVNLADDPIPGNTAHWFERGYDTADDVPRREQIKYIEDVLKGGNYKKNRFNEMHSDLGEVMIDCDEYILIPNSPSNKKALAMIARGEI